MTSGNIDLENVLLLKTAIMHSIACSDTPRYGSRSSLGLDDSFRQRLGLLFQTLLLGLQNKHLSDVKA